MFLRKFSFIKPHLPEPTQRQVYFVFIYSRLAYGTYIWGSTYDTHLKPIISIQKSFVRSLCNKGSFHSSLPCFALFLILPLYVLKVPEILYKISRNDRAVLDYMVFTSLAGKSLYLVTKMSKDIFQNACLSRT